MFSSLRRIKYVLVRWLSQGYVLKNQDSGAGGPRVGSIESKNFAGGG